MSRDTKPGDDELAGRRYRRSEAFFGRRKGQGLSAAQEKLLKERLPAYRLDLGSQAPDPLPQPFYLEIGFGGGEHLVHEAKRQSDVTFIGVEPFVNSMVKALRAIEQEKLQNIWLYDEDATELLDWLPDDSLDRIDLLYPDPWPKKRHWKRRFVNQHNLDRFYRVLKPGGIFRFASDIETYVNWTLNHCWRHPGFIWQARSAADWRGPWPHWPSTRYEAKAIREGRTPCYLIFEIGNKKRPV